MPGCEPEPAAPSSTDAAVRDGIVSLPSTRRYTSLRRRSDFQRVFRSGERVVSSDLTVLGLKGGTEARIGFVVGRRVGGAVARNRSRRRLRAAAARVAWPDGDYIVIATTAVDEAFAVLVDQMEESAQRWR